MLFFISDWHYDHENIIKYASRPFKNLDEMNRVLIERWNSNVSCDDVVVFGGDFLFGNPCRSDEILASLNGEKLLIVGNHDRHRTKTSPGWSQTANKLSFEECGYLFRIKHTPWKDEQFDPKVILLHGHTHGYFGKIHNDQIDISCENFDYSPVSLEKIIELWENHCANRS